MKTQPLRMSSPQEDRHGVVYLSRDKQPTMFQILSWKEDNSVGNSKDWLVNMQVSNRGIPRFTEPKVYEKPERSTDTRQKFIEGVGRSPMKNQTHGYAIKHHDLYYYGQDKNGRNKKEKEAKDKEIEKAERPKKEVKRLNKFNEEQKRQIEIRKQNIKTFDAFTRELPNSAFTTYFGKPAFDNYGYASNQQELAKHKSHSIMPHAGKNQPEFVQSHHGALKKANVINLQSHVPRKPTEKPANTDISLNVNQYYNVEIVKPDLINEVRFANEDHSLKYKPKTPKHNELNKLPKRNYKPPLQINKRVSPKKYNRAKTEEKDDGLAFMNQREKFMGLLEQKKKQQSRLAYKVTECYPLDWDFETEANSTGREQRWKQVRPAGISSARSVDAGKLLYR